MSACLATLICIFVPADFTLIPVFTRNLYAIFDSHVLFFDNDVQMPL
ncbi:hypothetical protein KKH3_40220 [Pectobacterium actinidiae]|nr:hypothetical protein KKH3_40220 [Pectobacterium actinidiae]